MKLFWTPGKVSHAPARPRRVRPRAAHRDSGLRVPVALPVWTARSCQGPSSSPKSPSPTAREEQKVLGDSDRAAEAAASEALTINRLEKSLRQKAVCVHACVRVCARVCTHACMF